MPEIPRISGRRAVAAFERAGFSLVRIKGSHHVLAKPGPPTVLSVPVHGNEDVGLGLLRSLFRNAGLTVEEFLSLL